MSELNEVINLNKSKYELLIDSVEALNKKIIKDSKRAETLKIQENKSKFIQFIIDYTVFFTETYSKFEKDFEIPFYELCSEIFPPENKAQLTINESSLSDRTSGDDVFQFQSLDSSEYKMYSSYVKSPALFFLHLETSIIFLKHQNKKLNEKYSSLKASDMLITTPKLNSVVAAQYTQDMCWYRAKIVDIDEKNKTVFVYYVDFGNSETQSISKLRQLESIDLKPLGQAIPCTLIHAFPLKSNDWESDAVIHFSELISNSELLVKINLRKDWPVNFCSIKIVDEINPDKNVLDLLVDENHARFEISILKQISTFLPILNSDTYFPKIKASSSQGSLIEVNEERVIPIRYIELDEDQSFDCEVVSVKNPNEFYIRPLSESSLDYLVLQEEMLEYYNSNKVLEKFYSSDKTLAVENKLQFHRALKISNLVNDSILMYFIDLGTYHKVSESNIYRLDDQFYKLPAKVIKCSLFNAVCKEEKWSKESIEWFKSSIRKFKNFSIKSFEDDKIIQISVDQTFSAILNSTKNNHPMYCFNNEILSFGFARSSSISEECLPTKRYLENSSNTRKDNVENTESKNDLLLKNPSRINDHNDAFINNKLLTNQKMQKESTFIETRLFDNELKLNSTKRINDEISIGRIKKELNELSKYKFQCASSISDNLLHLRATILGPAYSPYEDGTFNLKIDLIDYPFKPPKIVFETPIYHPNVDNNGELQIDILKSKWSPALNLSKILISIQSFLSDPDAVNAIRHDVGRLYRENRANFNKTAKEWTKKYAM